MYAKDLDDYMKWQNHWQANGWLLSSDLDNGLYTAIALKDARVLVLMWKDDNFTPPKVEETPQPEATTSEPISESVESIEPEIKEGQDAESAAIEHLSNL